MTPTANQNFFPGEMTLQPIRCLSLKKMEKFVRTSGAGFLVTYICKFNPLTDLRSGHNYHHSWFSDVMVSTMDNSARRVLEKLEIRSPIMRQRSILDMF